MILFMGVAGSGKSMQGKMLADRLALPWLSTGEFLRMLVHGPRRRDMTAGKLLADDEIIELVQKIFNIIDSHEEFILDGFPRSPAQADWLLNQVKHKQLKLTAVINLLADKDTVRSRLIERGRQDDTEAAISERFNEYEAAILPILNQFKEAGAVVIDIDSEGAPADIHQAIINRLAEQAGVYEN